MSNPLQKIRRAPAKIHLSAEARRLKAAIVGEFAIEDAAGLVVLQTALEARDRMRQAQIAADGLTCRDRFGQIKAHPLVTVERDARAQFLAGLKQLGLDLEPLHDGPGRPAGRGGLDE
jgi:hypothetical protein